MSSFITFGGHLATNGCRSFGGVIVIPDIVGSFNVKDVHVKEYTNREFSLASAIFLRDLDYSP